MSNMSKHVNIVDPVDEMDFEELLQQDTVEAAPAQQPASADDTLKKVISSLEIRFQEVTIMVNQAVKNREAVAEISRLMEETETTNQQLHYFKKAQGEKAQQSLSPTPPKWILLSNHALD